MGLIQKNPDPTQVHAKILSDAYRVILQTTPVTSWLNFGSSISVDQAGAFKWPEEARNESTGTLNANYTAGAGSLTVVDSAVFKVGDQIRIDGHRDTNGLQVIFRITVIPGGTTLTVTVIGGTDTSLTSTSQAIHRAGSVGDNRKPSDTEAMGKVTEPTLVTNYLQLFEDSWEIGEKLMRTADAGLLQGMETNDIVAKAREEALYRLLYQQYNAIINGAPAAETSAVGALMGGLLHYINTNTPNNRVNGGAATLTETMINDLVEKLVQRGLPVSTPMVLICNTTNSRVISSLRDSVVRTVDNPSARIGTAVTVYDSELAGWGNFTIVVDRNLPTYYSMIISPQYVSLHGQEGEQLVNEVDATVTGQHGIRTLVRSNLTMKVEAATYYHGVIYNLA